MTELRHLQLVILDIIKDIDIVCKNNGIVSIGRLCYWCDKT